MNKNKVDTFAFKNIIEKFLPGQKISQISPYGSGHINDTFLAIIEGSSAGKYILQRVNEIVFKNVPGLMNNIDIISDHILNKLKHGYDSSFRAECYTFLKSTDEMNYYNDTSGNFWRMTPFLENSRSFDVIDSGEKAYNGGKAYGEFQLMLSDLSPDLLIDTIPRFHDVEYRLQNLQFSIEEDKVGRVEQVRTEISFLKECSEEMKQILKAGKSGQIPLRITHNDTKFNNILFDDQEHVLGVIDLDTVMPGYIHYDFGDAIRTGAATAGEEEKNLDKVSLNIELFKAFRT